METINLLALCTDAIKDGPQWAQESDDLDVTLLSWSQGHRIEPYVNNEVDNLLVGVEGHGVITMDGKPHELRAGVALLIPKGAERGIESTSEKFCYLSVHKRRRGLMPRS